MSPSPRSLIVCCALSLIAAACGEAHPRASVHPKAVPATATGEVTTTAPRGTPAATHLATPRAPLAPNELGRIPILEYHMVTDSTRGMFIISRDKFEHDLELLYERGYRPVTVAELVDRKLDLPAGQSPVVFTFDDASPSQFRYVERADGSLEIDPTSVVGIWLAFHAKHPDWRNRATFCLLPSATAGHAFFGDKGIDGQKTEWRYRKVKFLADAGFELCDHTLWHARLDKYSDVVVQEQIARAQMAIDSAVPGYRVRTFALPLGMWPRNRALAQRGAWRDPKTGREVRYAFDAVLEVAGGPARSPYDPAFDAHKLPRIIVTGRALEDVLDQLERSGMRYVSDGDPKSVARPATRVAARPPAAPATRASRAQ